jgi:uncharacterized membrane protein YesL
MKRVIGVAWFAIRAVYDEMFLLAGMGLIWFLVGIVAPMGLFTLASLLSPVARWVGLLLGLLVLLPPVTAGLYSVAIEIAREKRIEFGYFWSGIRSYARLSWALGAVVLASGIIVVIDAVFYLSFDNVVFNVFGFLGLWALLFWLAAQIYLFPLMIMLKDKQFKLSVRNTSLLALAYPFFALGVLIVALLVTALSTVLFVPLATIWMPFIALLYSRATISSLQEAETFQQQIEPEEEQEEE